MERLFDALHIIFSNLSYYDLSQAAQVCKSWYYIARLEKQKRELRGPQLMSLPFTETHDYKKVVEPFYKSLRARPALSFYFMPWDYYDECPSPINLREDYELVGRINNLEYVQHIVSNVYFEDGNKSITGLFLPKLNSVSYNSILIDDLTENYDEDDEFSKIENKLLIDGDGHKCIIIMLVELISFTDDQLEKRERFVYRILENLKRRYKPGSYSVWGISPVSMRGNEIDTPDFFAVNILGSPISSHSMVLDIDVFLKDETQPVADILSKISPNSTTLLFFSIPEIVIGTKSGLLLQSKIDTLKQRFPTFQTMTVVSEGTFIGFDSHAADYDPVMLHETNICSILILNYKHL